MIKSAPNSRRNLDIAIQREFGKNYLEIRTLMANTIVAQLLPDCAVKGGSAIKFRLGSADTRFTSDLDAVYQKSLAVFIDALESALNSGWNGFGGRVVSRPPAKPLGVPRKYVMQPFEVKLSYLGRSWLTVPLEVGCNELDDASEPDWGIAQDVVRIFEQLGFPAPKAVPLMQLRHQIAQKLHGVSQVGSNRPHDLIDLQCVLFKESVNYKELKTTCRQLFAYRNMQSWPPIITKGSNWENLYESQARDPSVAKTVDEAIVWANILIAKIEDAE